MTNRPMSDREFTAWIVAGMVLLFLFMLVMTLVAGDGSHAHHIQQISGSHWQVPTPCK